jgi:hypothetical protein
MRNGPSRDDTNTDGDDDDLCYANSAPHSQVTIGTEDFREESIYE